MNLKKIKIRFIIAGIILIGITFIIGYLAGFSNAINMCAKVASKFVEIDYQTIRELLIKYGGTI